MIVRLLSVLVALVLAASPAVAASPDGVPVLMYHRIDAQTPGDAVGRSLTIEPDVFAAQLAWLRDNGIRTLTMEELAGALARGEHPHHVVVLTFDDGYRDAATVVTPILERYGARASFYVSAGFIGDERHASWTQLRAMHAAGMEIGCHGTHHLDLSKLTAPAAFAEVDHCVTTLAHYLRRPATYAYAAGKYNATVVALMRVENLKAALTERPGVVTSLAAPYTLPRRRVDRTAGLASFAALAVP